MSKRPPGTSADEDRPLELRETDEADLALAVEVTPIDPDVTRSALSEPPSDSTHGRRDG